MKLIPTCCAAASSVSAIRTKSSAVRQAEPPTSAAGVTAQSEVVSLVADNTPVFDIIRALDKAVASRTVSLAGRLGREEKEKHHYMMTGGVAKNTGVVKALEEKLGAPVVVSEHAQICGAIGAALIALGQ